MNPTFRSAQERDWDAIAGLLQSASLPLDGAQEHLTNFVLAYDGEQLAGVAGMECYGDVGLLRSVAVANPRQGLGQRLVQRVLQRAAQQGMQQIVLLTTTAADYFPRFGFQVISRADAPTAAYQSVEFQGACPDSSTVMLLDLASHAAL
jgi:amino-acid N-acetyltransferase